MTKETAISRMKHMPYENPRMHQILQILSEGKRIKHAAQILGISKVTVNHYLYTARKIYDCATTEQMIAYGVHCGIIHVDD